MRTLKEISWDVPESEYRADKALSYSTIARFAREGFEKLDSLFEKVESPSLLFGSLVDTMVTEPENYSKLYCVGDIPQLSDSLGPIASAIVDELGTYSSLDAVPDDFLAEIGKRHNYYRDDKYKALRVKKIREACSEYFDLSKSLGDKKLIPRELHNEAVACYEELKANEYTSWIFGDDIGDVERYYQLKFKGEYEGIMVRCMMDAVLVDHKNKTIQPIDLKTSFKHESKFYLSFKEWRYDIQASLYTYILEQCLKGTEYEDYKILDYLFVVISKSSKSPMTWLDTKSKAVNNEWRDLVKELDFYLNREENKYPIWVKPINTIQDFLDE